MNNDIRVEMPQDIEYQIYLPPHSSWCWTEGYTNSKNYPIHIIASRISIQDHDKALVQAIIEEIKDVCWPDKSTEETPTTSKVGAEVIDRIKAKYLK